MTTPNLTEAARKCAEEMADIVSACSISRKWGSFERDAQAAILRHFTALQEQWGKDKERLEARIKERDALDANVTQIADSIALAKAQAKGTK